MPDIDVVRQASQGEEAIRLVRATTPDVALVDIRMPVLDGIEATRRITADPACAATRVVSSSARCGSLPRERRSFSGRDPAADRGIRPDATTGTRHTTPPTLTDREADVPTLVGQGLSNGDIAARLHVARATIKTYVGRLLAKLDAPARVHLVIQAAKPATSCRRGTLRQSTSDRAPVVTALTSNIVTSRDFRHERHRPGGRRGCRPTA
jgi:DNA-binding NarL/FixJ family response regulator